MRIIKKDIFAVGAIDWDRKLFERLERDAEGLMDLDAEVLIPVVERACEINADDYNAPILLAATYFGLDRKQETEAAYEKALLVIEKHLELNPDDARALYFGASALCHQGKTEKAIKWAEKATIIDPDNPSVLYNVACVYAQLGEIDRGIDCLEQSITTGMGQKEWIENDPDLDPLRESSRFAALVESLNKES